MQINLTEFCNNVIKRLMWKDSINKAIMNIWNGSIKNQINLDFTNGKVEHSYNEILLYACNKLLEEHIEYMSARNYVGKIEEIGDIYWYLMLIYILINDTNSFECDLSIRISDLSITKQCVKISSSIVKHIIHNSKLDLFKLNNQIESLILTLAKKTIKKYPLKFSKIVNIPDNITKLIEIIINENEYKLMKRHGNSYNSKKHYNSNTIGKGI